MWHSAGHLLHSGGSVTGKRERESERDLDGEDDTLSTSHKLQRLIVEVTSVHATSGNQPSMVNITSILDVQMLRNYALYLRLIFFCSFSRKVRWMYHRTEQNRFKIRPSEGDWLQIWFQKWDLFYLSFFFHFPISFFLHVQLIWILTENTFFL